jgi:hypothetical protein
MRREDHTVTATVEERREEEEGWPDCFILSLQRIERREEGR